MDPPQGYWVMCLQGYCVGASMGGVSLGGSAIYGLLTTGSWYYTLPMHIMPFLQTHSKGPPCVNSSCSNHTLQLLSSWHALYQKATKPSLESAQHPARPMCVTSEHRACLCKLPKKATKPKSKRRWRPPWGPLGPRSARDFS